MQDQAHVDALKAAASHEADMRYENWAELRAMTQRAKAAEIKLSALYAEIFDSEESDGFNYAANDGTEGFPRCNTDEQEHDAAIRAVANMHRTLRVRAERLHQTKQ